MRESQAGRRHLGRIRTAVLVIALASTAPAFVRPTDILPWLWLVGLVLVQGTLMLGSLSWSGPGLLRAYAAADILFLASAGALVGTDLFGLVCVPVIWVAAWLSATDAAWTVVVAAALSGFSAPDAVGDSHTLSNVIVRAAVLGLIGAATHVTASIRAHDAYDWRALIDLPHRRRAIRPVDDVPRVAEVLQAFLGAARALVFVPGPGGLILEDTPLDMGDAEADAANDLARTDLLRAALTSGRPIAVGDSATEPRLPHPVVVGLGARTMLVVPVPLADATVASVIVLTRSIAAAFTEEDAGVAALVVLASTGAASSALRSPATDPAAAEPIITAGMEAAFEAADTAAVILDPRERLVTFNAVAEALFALDTEAAGEQASARIADDTIHKLVRESGDLNAPRALRVAPPGAAWSEVEVMPLFANDQRIGSLLLAHPRDEAAARAALDQVLASVSHELRTPLTAIRAYLDTLLRAGDFDPETRCQFLHIAREQTTRLTDAVEGLLAAADKGVDAPQTGPRGAVGPAVRTAVAGLSYCLCDRELQLSLLDPSPDVRAPGSALEFGVRQLLLDALTRADRQAPVVVRETADAQEVVLSVGFAPDAALGANNATAETMGALLGTSPRPGGGMGLGLHLARRTLEPYGGQVEAGLTNGDHASWRVRLPKA